MKLLDTTATREMSFFSRVRHAIITNANSLLIWTKMLLNVGFVIIAVVILGILLGVLVRIDSYRNGTKFQVAPILVILIAYSWMQANEIRRKNSIYRKSSKP